jgi:biotin synthase-like enzyme
MLSELELTQLGDNCARFVASFRLAFPEHKIVTPKLHVIEKHIPDFARRFGTCGVFGEDGLESLHPMDTRARQIVRTMRNATKRHQAATKHLAIKTQHKKEKDPQPVLADDPDS